MLGRERNIKSKAELLDCSLYTPFEEIKLILTERMVIRSSRLLACDDLDLSSCSGSPKKYQVQGRAA